MPKVEELEEKITKFEDKIQLGGLVNEKRFADLELKIGELNEKLKEVTTDFPKLKERAVEIEDLLNVINLGLSEYKDDFDKVDSRISDFQKLPETLESVRSNLESKMRELNESVKGLNANVEVLKNIKEDIIKNTEETISSKVKLLEESLERNKAEVEHVKKDLDGFSVALRAFERTIEMTNLDDIIRRFDSLDKKIINNETELEKFRRLVPDMSMAVGDVEVLKKRLKELSSSVMDVLTKMNEFELSINKKIPLLEELAKKAETEDFKTTISKLDDTKNAVEKVYGDVNEKFSRLAAISDEVNMIKTDIETLKTMKTTLNEAVTTIKNESVKEIVSQPPADYEMRMGKLEEQVRNIPSLNIDSILAEVRQKTNEVNNQSTGNIDNARYEALTKKIEDLERVMMNMNKEVPTPQPVPRPIEVEPRILKVDNVIKQIPKNVSDEIVSLKDIVSRVSSDNNDLKKVIMDLRIDQMQSITTDIFVNVTARVSTIEKKLSEIEEEISKMRSIQ